jgi:hypothetical protein
LQKHELSTGLTRIDKHTILTGMEYYMQKQLILDEFQKPVGVKYRDLVLKIKNNSFIDEYVKEHHYSHKITKNRFLSMGVYLGNSSEILGFIQLGYGIRPKIKTSVILDIQKGNYCEFDRMWLSDALPKYSETIVISMLLYFIKYWSNHIKYIITYADGSVGNVGTIYKASNAIYLGKIQVDFYKLITGERVHPVTMWHWHKTRKKEVLEKIYPGIQHIRNSYHYRYVYILDKKERKKFLRNLTTE